MAMHPGEAKPYRLPRSRAANDNRGRATWRRVVAAAVAASFALMLVSLGFHRYAHHVWNGPHNPAAFLIPN